MKTVTEIRLVRLKQLVDEHKTLARLKDAAGFRATDSTLSQMLNESKGSKTSKPKTIGDALARRLEDACSKPRGWMDNDPEMSPEAVAELLRGLSVSGLALALAHDALPPGEERHRLWTKVHAQLTIKLPAQATKTGVSAPAVGTKKVPAKIQETHHGKSLARSSESNAE